MMQVMMKSAHGEAGGPVSGARVREVSATVPNWNREKRKRFWEPNKQLIAAIRSYQSWSGKRGFIASSMRYFAVFRHRLWSTITGADIPLNASIGGGLLLTHPNGVVIHPCCVIGVNCLIFQQVTLGTGGKKKGVPTLGGHVDIGAGAKILGGVRIGNHVKIGANAVVIDDVPDGATAVGVPARILINSTVDR